MSEIRRNYVTMYLVLLALGEIEKKRKTKRGVHVLEQTYLYSQWSFGESNTWV